MSAKTCRTTFGAPSSDRLAESSDKLAELFWLQANAEPQAARSIDLQSPLISSQSSGCKPMRSRRL